MEPAGTQRDTDLHTYSLMDTGMLIDIHGNPDLKEPDNQITDIQQYFLTKHTGTYRESLKQTQADEDTPTHIHIHRHPRTQVWTQMTPQTLPEAHDHTHKQ